MRVTLIALFASLFVLSACGQKGPLYLPQDPAAKPSMAEQPPEPAAQQQQKTKIDVPADVNN